MYNQSFGGVFILKTIIINELEELILNHSEFDIPFIFDLANQKVKNCIGCWSCWWKTPGRCIYKELDEFYHEYITADKAIYFAKTSNGFVTSNMKNLFDRMIPLYLPYTTYETGESMHVKRYEKYPDIEFYYDGRYLTEEERRIFVDYVERVFYQFYSKVIKIADISEYKKVRD